MPPKKAKSAERSESQDNKSPGKKKLHDNDTKSPIKESKASHIRDIITPKDLTNISHIKIMSWNVAGLRGLLKKQPNILENLVTKHNIDILCLQETKLQSIDDVNSAELLPLYNSYWTFSEVKKGYSGVAIFIKKTIELSNDFVTIKSKVKSKQLTLSNVWQKSDIGTNKNNKVEDIVEIKNSNDNTVPFSYPLLTINSVKYEFDNIKFSGEGRTITIDLGLFYVVGCYVPNSGANLERLDYRVNEWDIYIRSYLHELKNTKPVIFFGDLNVGHLHLDIYNPTAKHIVKQAGLTPQERNSMTDFLSKGFTDAFRFFYPDARGAFTYWSQRTFARNYNNGIRLDYFICSNNMFGNIVSSNDTTSQSPERNLSSNDTTSESPERKLSPNKRKLDDQERFIEPVEVDNIPIPGVYDSYIVHEDTVGFSDHCPVVLVVKII